MGSWASGAAAAVAINALRLILSFVRIVPRARLAPQAPGLLPAQSSHSHPHAEQAQQRYSGNERQHHEVPKGPRVKAAEVEPVQAVMPPAVGAARGVGV